MALGGGGCLTTAGDCAYTQEMEMSSATTSRKPTPRSKDRHFTTRGAAFVVSMPAAREESSGIRAIAGTRRRRRTQNCYQATSLFELHVNAATSRVDGNALLRGGNAD